MNRKIVPEVKKLRVILGWSQLKLAKEMGISQSVISSVENGLVEPSKLFQNKLDKVKKQQRITKVDW
jgi:transcriptional regulator with XRE-family HTH domain